MSDRNLEHLFPEFRKHVDSILMSLHLYALKHQPGIEWKLVEGFRTAREQNKIFKKNTPNAWYTDKDGYVKKSKHQYGASADFLPFKDGKVVTVSKDHWNYLGHLARARGLIWGGNWTKMDMPHVELPLNSTKLRQINKWKKENNLA